MTDRQRSAAGQTSELDRLVTVRLIQINTYALDAAATPFIDRAEKIGLLDELVAATSNIPAAVDRPSHLQPLSRLAYNDSLMTSVQAMAQGLRSRLGDHEQRAALVEAVTTTAWPKGVSWVADRNLALGESVSLFMPRVAADEVAQIEQTYRSALKRLQQDSIAPGVQVTQVAVMAAVTAASGGLATGIGTLVGTHVLGLSGAAATSAGLALLGGGSLASGGLGMAGGIHILHLATWAAKSGGRNTLSRLATLSTDAFLETLAKLDALVAMDPSHLPDALTHLESIQVDLQAQLKAVQPDDLAARRIKIAQSAFRGATNFLATPGALREVREAVSPEERRLARALRAVEFELLHLRSPEWKRQVSRLPRAMRLPGAWKWLNE